MYFFVYHQNSLCRRCLIICFIVKETEAKRGCKTCLRHMASECGDWIEGQAVLASAAEISCERPGRPLNIQIKPRRNMNAPIQALWCIEAENREKHQEVEVICVVPHLPPATSVFWHSIILIKLYVASHCPDRKAKQSKVLDPSSGWFSASQGDYQYVRVVVLDPSSLGSNPGSALCYLLGNGPVP